MNRADRQKVFEKYGGKCAYCGCELVKGWHVDHIEPVRRIYDSVKEKDSWRWKTVYKGMANPHLDTVENAMPSCAKCNINKHGDSIEEFRSNIERYLRSLNERMVQYQMAKKYGLVKETGAKVVFYFETIEHPHLIHQT